MKKPLYTNPHRDDTLEECSDLLRRYNNLEDGIRRDRSAVTRLSARIRQIEKQIADIRAVDRSPKPVIPGFNTRPGKPPSINPWSWAAEQGQEILTSLQRDNDARARIADLQRDKADLQFQRDRSQRLLTDSEAGQARLLQQMRDLGCPAAGRTNL